MLAAVPSAPLGAIFVDVTAALTALVAAIVDDFTPSATDGSDVNATGGVVVALAAGVVLVVGRTFFHTFSYFFPVAALEVPATSLFCEPFGSRLCGAL